MDRQRCVHLGATGNHENVMSDQRLADFQASEIVAHAPDVLTVEDDFHGVGLLSFNVINLNGSVLGSALPLAWKAASLIEKETF